MSDTDDRMVGIVVRAVEFLWPERWTRTRRGLWFCVIATFALAGALIGALIGVCLAAAGVSL